MADWDVIVVGQGVVGCAARAYLAQRGARVLGLEQASPGHDGGSSHGESRVIREANFENPGYAELISRSIALWSELEDEPGSILVRCGVLEAAASGSAYLEQTLMAAEAAGVGVETVGPAGVKRRFPAIALPGHWSAAFQPGGGFLRADRAIARYLAIAGRLGSELRVGERVRSVEQVGDHVEVRTAAGEMLVAGTAIVSTGPWISELVPELRPLVRLTRQVLAWYEPRDTELFSQQRFPVFLFSTDLGFIYGFPNLPGHGVKVALHEPGSPLGHAGDARQDAATAEARPLRAGVRTLLPGLPETAARVRTCIYTTTPDEEFIVARRPGADRIWFASACSGHGFKFASAIGEALTDLASGASPRCDMAPFGLDRFS